jgi:hypothetical protein
MTRISGSASSDNAAREITEVEARNRWAADDCMVEHLPTD